MMIKTTIDQVVEHITKAIFSGKFQPGSRLKENEISEWLGVSRTPIREAFRILESKGLLESNSNKGMRIPVVTLEDLEEICEMRILIESFCIRKFVREVNQDHIRTLEEIVAEMEKAATERDYLSYFDHSIKFHAYYMMHCRNKRLYDAFSLSRNTIQCAQLLLQKNPRSYGESINEHREMLEALKRKDVEQCEKLLRIHLRENCERMKNGLSCVLNEKNRKAVNE